MCTAVKHRTTTYIGEVVTITCPFTRLELPRANVKMTASVCFIDGGASISPMHTQKENWIQCIMLTVRGQRHAQQRAQYVEHSMNRVLTIQD